MLIKWRAAFFAFSLVIVLGGIVDCTPLPTASPPSGDLQSAREALNLFFSLLHDERYSEAVNYYGGPLDAFRYWDPSAGDDKAELFKSACATRLKCLGIMTVLREQVMSPTEFRFVVQFMNDDGALFEHGPCCGGDEMPQTQFAYTVKKFGSKFLVQEMPIVLP